MDITYMQGIESLAGIRAYRYIRKADISNASISIDVVIIGDKLPVYGVVWLCVPIVVIGTRRAPTIGRTAWIVGATSVEVRLQIISDLDRVSCTEIRCDVEIARNYRLAWTPSCAAILIGTVLW